MSRFFLFRLNVCVHSYEQWVSLHEFGDVLEDIDIPQPIAGVRYAYGSSRSTKALLLDLSHSFFSILHALRAFLSAVRERRVCLSLIEFLSRARLRVIFARDSLPPKMVCIPYRSAFFVSLGGKQRVSSSHSLLQQRFGGQLITATPPAG